MKYKYAFFDFDGTVADTKRGIMNSAKQALQQFGITTDEETLRSFVGPTLWHSFETLFGFDYEKQNEAVDFYREYYTEKGMYEAEIYPGMKELLANLKAKGIKLGIASAKNEICVIDSCKHYGVYDMFDVIAGSFENGDRSSKDELIAYLMEQMGLKDISECVFVGDSHTDFNGANALGMDFIAALYDRDSSEFEGLECEYYANTVQDIGNIILGA